jgi:serpin B
MKVLIDTNVIMDVLVGREPFLQMSRFVVRLCDEGVIEGYLAAHSITNLFYMLRKYYDAKVYEEPFDNATVGKINQWVSDQTRGKITNIVDNIEDDAMAFITNAVYFNSDWEKKYDATVPGKFAGSDGKTKKVKMLEGMEETYITARGAKGFIKEYEGGDFAMMTLLPPKNTTARKFAMSMTGKDWIDAYRNRVTENIHVYTRMPEFQYEYEAELNKVFRSMGMEMAFSDFADFSKMAAPSLKIDGILHKTFIRVDKDGTEAAAVTNIGMKLTSAMPKPEQWIEKKVYLTRPFVYAIIDTKTGIPLFVSVLEQV